MLIFLFVALIFLVPVIIVAAIIAAVVKSEDNRNSVQPPPVNYVYSSGTEVKNKPVKKLSASVVMLLIGTVFIILAAITFVAANWVKMQPEGRIFAIAGSAVLAFCICGVMKAAAGLERTSAAFYAIGSLMSVITLAAAGYYEIFGSWFSLKGDGEFLFYSVMSLIVAAASFIGYPIYKAKALHYVGFSFISIALFTGCLQVDDAEQFAVIIAVAQLAITALLHVIKPQKGTLVEGAAVLIGDITAILYELVALGYVFISTFSPTSYSFAILAMLLLQFYLYGSLKNQKWMLIFANVFLVYASLMAVIKVRNEIGTDYTMLIFSFITMVIYLVNRFIPNNLEPSRIISLVCMGAGAVVSLFAGNEDLYGLNLIVPAVFSLSIISCGLGKNEIIRIISGFTAPIMPFCMAVFLANRIDKQFDFSGKNEVGVIVFGGFVLVCIAVAAFFIKLPVIFKKYQAVGQGFSPVMIYSNLIVSAAVLMVISTYSELFFVVIGLCLIHFIVSHMANYNITSEGSVIALIGIVSNVIKHDLGDNKEVGMYILFAVFIAFIVISRFVFPESITEKGNGKFRIDTLYFGAWAGLFMFPLFDKTANFLRLILIAVILAGMIRKNTKQNTSAVCLSVSTFFAAVAFMARPFLNPDSSMISSKINLGILLLLGIAYKFIWKNNKAVSKISSTTIFVITFAGLIIDGLIYSNVLNKIFVLTVTAAVLVLSFFVKSKTWFIASSLALVIITVFSTRKYFDTAGWWLYLLIVGVIFVAIAAVNEACKKKGETVKSAAAKKFSDWTW